MLTLVARTARLARSFGTACLVLALVASAAHAAPYDDLLALHADWRTFERPPLRDGAPDYTAATTARRHAELARFQARLNAIDPQSWPAAQQVDWHIVRAEMNGFDFAARVLKPWERDPAFYVSVWTAQSDTPAHEGPMHHAPVELWQYEFPLTPDAAAKLVRGLRTIPPLLAQAKLNLTGNARDLWLAGIASLQQQDRDLAELAAKTAKNGRALRTSIEQARAATTALVAWLEQQAPSKNGPSGVGTENYTWMLQNVQLIPYTWEEERALLERELARAHAGLLLEEVRNRGLPPLEPIMTAADYERRSQESITKFMEFLRRTDVHAIMPWTEPQMRSHTFSFVPLEKRDFFTTVSHLEPMALFLHWYHWWDHGMMETAPHASPIRSSPLLYNVWAGRSEGMATANEEIMLHAGVFDAEPRARELVWVMLAARAARGLASLYAQANVFTMKQASDFHVEWTPRGWMKRDSLLGFEQQLYLRQPGYGSSYVTGKAQIDALLQARAKQLGAQFTMRRFFEEFDAAGLVPVSLIRLELTGTGCCTYTTR